MSLLQEKTNNQAQFFVTIFDDANPVVNRSELMDSMSDPPSTQSSPSDQLAAFSPNTVEAASQRTPGVFPGVSTLRSA